MPDDRPLLIWINGPFGGGKTQTAHALARRLGAPAVICDPEEVGFGLQRAAPAAVRGDFQDYRSWRTGVVEVLEQALQHSPIVIAPMTVVDATAFDETVGELRRRGHRVRHFTLLADPATVERRLRERAVVHRIRRALGQASGGYRDSFAMTRLTPYLAQLRRPEFAEHVHTDHLTVAQVTEHLAAASGLTLHPDRDGRVRRRLRRAAVGLRHVRFR